jgi:hypothetical protein
MALYNGYPCTKTEEISLLKSMGLGFVTITMASSAYKIGLDLLVIIFGKSYIYNEARARDIELNLME